MSCIPELLAQTARRFEPELQSRLNGVFGGIVGSYLPQTWVFRTDDGVASLLVDREGRVSVQAGEAPRPDVTVEISHDRLAAALRGSDRGSVPSGPLTVTPHTSKGKTAFDYLRSRLGL
jgi:hypothetical protein